MEKRPLQLVRQGFFVRIIRGPSRAIAGKVAAADREVQAQTWFRSFDGDLGDGIQGFVRLGVSIQVSARLFIMPRVTIQRIKPVPET